MAKQRKRDRWPELCKALEADDGLPVRDSGPWAEHKLHFWNGYLDITTKAMVGHHGWAAGLVYVDLFAGPGVCQVEASGRRFPGSPLIAALTPKPFRKILLCELDDSLAAACEARLQRVSTSSEIHVFRGDCNERAREIVKEIPPGALTLAFLDPEGLDIHFDTVALLAQRGRVDLLILLADAVDFSRNVERYYRQADSKLDAFLGPNCGWRTAWSELGNTQGSHARKFLLSIYRSQLKNQLGYVQFGEKSIHSRKGPIYRLLYASKHERGLDFWHKVTKKDVAGQNELF